jgi:SAM-dependent methyltransferase
LAARYGLSTGPGLYVEIGFGEAPAALHGPIPFSGAYLGFEAANGHGYPTSPDVEKYASVVLRALPGLARAHADRAGKRIALAFADARGGGRGGLPLPGGCATEVYMANVLTSPLRAGDRERTEILREAMRVLRPGGGLVLRVSWGGDAQREWRQKRLKRMVRSAGFWVVCACARGEPAHAELEWRYGRTPQQFVDYARYEDPHVHYQAYFIVARKPSGSTG